MPLSFCKDQGESDISDRSTRNNFRFEWLALKDENGDFLSEWLRKPTENPGHAFSIICNKLINYSSTGKKCVFNHAKSKKHRLTTETVRSNKQLPSFMNTTSTDSSLITQNLLQSLPYGTPDNVLVGANMPNEEPIRPKYVSTLDRRAHLEATFLLFLKERKLPMAMSPHLLDLCQFFGRELSLVSSLSLSRSAATYKLVEGLAPSLKERLIYDLRISLFSLNIDECMSKPKQKILTVLLQYFSVDEGHVVCKHYF